MRVEPIEPGDVVEVDKKGRRVVGLVLGVGDDGTIALEPFCRGVSWRSARPREVLRHWRRAGRGRRAAEADVHEAQMQFGAVLES